MEIAFQSSAHDTFPHLRFAPILSRLLVHLLQDHAHPILPTNLVAGWYLCYLYGQAFHSSPCQPDCLEPWRVLTLIVGPFFIQAFSFRNCRSSSGNPWPKRLCRTIGARGSWLIAQIDAMSLKLRRWLLPSVRWYTTLLYLQKILFFCW